MKSVVCLKDTAAQYFGTPFFVQAPAQAVRSVREEVNSKDSQSDLRKHPDDFELYHVADFDDETGVLTPRSPLVFLCRAKDLRDSE